MKVNMKKKRKGKEHVDKDVDSEAGNRVLICPQCQGTDIWFEAGLVTGYKYHCKSCDYIGAYIIQKDVPR